MRAPPGPWSLGKGGLLNHLAGYWGATKKYISVELGITHALLHVGVGLIGYLLSGWLMQRRLGNGRALIPILILELANEIVDCVQYATSGWPWAPVLIGSAEDIVATMALPLLLTFVIWTVRTRTHAHDG